MDYMRITAKQIQKVLNDLPEPEKVDGKYVRIRMVEDATTRKYNNIPIQFFEFEKSEDGREWCLFSTPYF